MLSFRNLIVLHFIFMSMSHFELIFMKDIIYLFIFACGWPVFLAPFKKMVCLIDL